jgi:hypothetical protein
MVAEPGNIGCEPRGVTAVPDFPKALYSAIVSYSQRRFGISIADPEVRMALEAIKGSDRIS